MTTINQKKVTARKDHRCDWCGLAIVKGEQYHTSFNEHCGDVYTWKNHQHCQDIAEELSMFDDADEGVTEDHFSEAIDAEYSNIMSKYHNEVYESDAFTYPAFTERLTFVLNHHKINHTL